MVEEIVNAKWRTDYDGKPGFKTTSIPIKQHEELGPVKAGHVSKIKHINLAIVIHFKSKLCS